MLTPLRGLTPPSMTNPLEYICYTSALDDITHKMLFCLRSMAKYRTQRDSPTFQRNDVRDPTRESQRSTLHKKITVKGSVIIKDVYHRIIMHIRWQI